MELRDIKTLQEISKEYNIPFTTLQTRLSSKGLDLVDGKDFKRLGKRMPTIFSPKGILKITKSIEEV